jgi:hypothetical protein
MDGLKDRALLIAYVYAFDKYKDVAGAKVRSLLMTRILSTKIKLIQVHGEG